MEKAADPEVQIMSRFLRDVEYEHIASFRFPDDAAAIGKILSEEKQHFLMLSGLLKRLQGAHSCDTGPTD